MPGAWEIKAHQSVLIGVLCVNTVTPAWAFALRRLQIPGRIVGICGKPFDDARNHLCRTALENGFEWAGFLDSDVIMPDNGFLTLLSRQKPVISGVYHRRSFPAGIPVMQKPAGQWMTNYPKDRLIEVDTIGAGALLIHRDVLNAMKPVAPGKPWFYWKSDLKGIIPDLECRSEDFVFVTEVKRQLGITVYADTSVICKHIGDAEFMHNQAFPLDPNCLVG